MGEDLEIKQRALSCSDAELIRREPWAKHVLPFTQSFFQGPKFNGEYGGKGERGRGAAQKASFQGRKKHRENMGERGRGAAHAGARRLRDREGFHQLPGGRREGQSPEGEPEQGGKAHRHRPAHQTQDRARHDFGEEGSTFFLFSFFTKKTLG